MRRTSSLTALVESSEWDIIEVYYNVEYWLMVELLNVRCAYLASRWQWLPSSGEHTVWSGAFAHPQILAAPFAILGLLLMSDQVSRGSLTFLFIFLCWEGVVIAIDSQPEPRCLSHILGIFCFNFLVQSPINHQEKCELGWCLPICFAWWRL